jgi:putative toxin-antitoxin system antitoxin component (TIGR02293 family)
MEPINVQMGDWLGFPPPATGADILHVVEARLSPSVISRLIAAGLQRAEIDTAIIPLRTLQHRRSRREKLTIEESDRVLRMIRVLSLAETVYGSRERALAWLRTPKIEGRTPLSLLNTDAGSRMVEELLIQIDDGMFV